MRSDTASAAGTVAVGGDAAAGATRTGRTPGRAHGRLMKNVAPAPIENALKNSRYISQAVVLGDRRKFLAALLVPDFDALKGWAERQGMASRPETLVGDPKVRALIEQEVKDVNANLAGFEKIVHHPGSTLKMVFKVRG